jgi:hypothetical protein
MPNYHFCFGNRELVCSVAARLNLADDEARTPRRTSPRVISEIFLTKTGVSGSSRSRTKKIAAWLRFHSDGRF